MLPNCRGSGSSDAPLPPAALLCVFPTEDATGRNAQRNALTDIHALKFLQRYSMTVALNQMKISSLRKIKTTHTTCSKRPACQQQPSQRQGEQISPVGPKQPAVPLLRGLPTHLQGVSFTSQKTTALTALLSTVKPGRHSKILFYFPAAASPIQLAASYHLQRSVAFFGDGGRAPETPLYIKVTSLLHSEDEL